MPASAPAAADPVFDVSRAPLCAGCTYARRLPGAGISGNPHTKCRHPRTEAVHATPLAAMIEASGALPVPAIGITVEGDPRAIEAGRFAWPISFDPRFLLSCDGRSNG